MSTSREKIISKAIELLKSSPAGLRYSDFVRKIHTKLPEIPVNTINGTVWNLETRVPDEVYRPARGLFRHVSFREEKINEERLEPPTKTKKIIREEDFYESFADWLVNGLEKCTKTISFGGNKFKDKWGTP